MLFYAVKRLGLALLICMVAMTVMFSLVYLIPGDPASIALGPLATPEMRAALTARMGLDKPLLVQIVHFFSNVLSGDLGVDVWSDRSVTAMVFESLPYTLVLALAGLGWATLLGIPLGCYSAVRRNSLFDKVAAALSVGAISMPSFVVAIYSLLLFAVKLGWFPAIGAGEAGRPLDQVYHLVLPAFAIGFGWVGYLARLVRASMLEVMGEPHIRTARAFGLPERMIIFRYALRIAVLPTITVLSLGAGGLLSSAVFTEIVFDRPGIGQLVLGAVNTRNYPVVMGAVVVTIGLFTLVTLIGDLLVAVYDPRVRAGL
jgi:peptide/nickel transport system permease protein